MLMCSLFISKITPVVGGVFLPLLLHRVNLKVYVQHGEFVGEVPELTHNYVDVQFIYY